MHCSRCNHDNPEDASFCGACGGTLAATLSCPRCGRDNAPGQRFCHGCGTPLAAAAAAPPARDPRVYTPKHLVEKILTSRSALEGERKQVTVLFADIRGSMELSDGLDAETLHRVMDRFFAILADGVHRFEGTINQYTGDGIMALFGAPIAHEDHAQRACFAALHLTEELRRYGNELRLREGRSFAVRMGLNSGEVVVGKIGDDLRMDYTAQGQTVGLAARMEQIAEPGKVYLTEHTAKLAAGYVELRDLGESDVKGLRTPVRVYELSGIGAMRTRLDVSRARGFSRFVGRGDEMGVLETALEHARAGNGQVIGIVAQAGIGKSRLCHEFAERCRARGIPVYEAHCPAHGKSVPFLPVLEYLRSYFGISERDADQAAREKVAGKVLLLDRDLTDALPLVFDFLGIPDPARPAPRIDPEARQRQLLAAVRQLSQAQSRREPGVSILDDLHWIDPGSDTFLENFVDAVPGTRGLLVLNFRPEYHAEWMRTSHYQRLPLSPLGREAIAKLLDELVGTDASLTALRAIIESRTEGNPFFTEEVVQSLVEAGALEGSRGVYRLTKPVEQVPVPAAVQAVLAARIDRLGERDKRLLQAAAVVGIRVPEAILQRVAELPEAELADALRDLTTAEFLHAEALYPEAVYAFKHPLTQEVAYHSQLVDRRRAAHGAVARAITDVYREKLDEQAALLAHHWEATGNALEAARWHLRAAERVGTSDLGAALHHARKVRALLAEAPESNESMDLRLAGCLGCLTLGWRLGMPLEESEAMYAEGTALAARRGDVRSLVLLEFSGPRVNMRAGASADDAAARAVKARRLAAQVEDDIGLNLLAAQNAAYWTFTTGRLGPTLAMIDEALALPGANPRVGSELLRLSPYTFLVGLRGAVLTYHGRFGEGLVEFERATQLARENGDVENLGWFLGAQSFYALLTGDVDRVHARVRQAVQIAERLGSPFSQLWSQAQLGLVHLVREEWAEAVAALEGAIGHVRQLDLGVEAEASFLPWFASAYGGQGDLTRARATAEEAVTIARRRRQRIPECYAHLVLARVLLRREPARDLSAAGAALECALALVNETGARGIEPLIRTEIGEAARLAGHGEKSAFELRAALHLFTEMGATVHAERLGRRLAAEGVE